MCGLFNRAVAAFSHNLCGLFFGGKGVTSAAFWVDNVDATVVAPTLGVDGQVAGLLELPKAPLDLAPGERRPLNDVAHGRVANAVVVSAIGKTDQDQAGADRQLAHSPRLVLNLVAHASLEATRSPLPESQQSLDTSGPNRGQMVTLLDCGRRDKPDVSSWDPLYRASPGPATLSNGPVG